MGKKNKESDTARSIVTKRGDNGTTDRLYGGTARKSDLLLEAIGDIDELSAWIGMAAKNGKQGNDLVKSLNVTFSFSMQNELRLVMGELSAGKANLSKYRRQFGAITRKDCDRLETFVHEIEKQVRVSGWSDPDSQWDVACRVCRRAERSLWKYHFEENASEPSGRVRREVLIYFNRLSDLLWAWARI